MVAGDNGEGTGRTENEETNSKEKDHQHVSIF